MGKWNYGIVLDAGSSGTRLHVYRWPKPSKARVGASMEELERLPAIETKKKWTTKKKPGLSTFNEDPNGVEHYLDELFEHTTDIIPKDEISNTPVFLLATAGMRLLPGRERNAILDAVCRHTKSTTQFQIPDCDLHVQVIPGSTEGLYGWIAANYLLDGFDRPPLKGNTRSHDTYGFLDMGGASAQIAFAPNTTEAEKHADDLTLLRLRTLDGSPTEYGVFTTTWLGFGVNEARRRYLEELHASMDTDESTAEIPDPCLPIGLRIEADESGAGLVGTGKFAECIDRTTPLLHKDAHCIEPPCLFDGQHAPAIDFSVNHFVGVSEYWHTTHEIFEMGHTDKAYDFETYQHRVAEFCQQDWDTISEGLEEHKWGKKVDEKTAAEVCFKASWLINVLHNGIGVPRKALDPSTDDSGHNTTKQILDKAKQNDYLAPFQAVNKIDSTEVSWTLGKMVLYASSQVPPADESVLAVGFGSNDPSLPSDVLPQDFQFAGGSPGGEHSGFPDLNTPLPPPSNPLLTTTSLHRRAPGFLLIGAIIFVIALLLCGRDRRNDLFSRLTSCCGRRNNRHSPSSSLFPTPRKQGRGGGGANGGWSSKLPFGLGSHSSGRYERLPVDAEAGDVELGNVPYSDSDSVLSLNGDDGGSGSSMGTRRARSRNGLATPKLGELNSAPQGNNSSSTQGVGLGLNGVASDRGNVVNGYGYFSQSAAGETTGHRSRAGSPTRWRSPGLTPKDL